MLAAPSGVMANSLRSFLMTVDGIEYIESAGTPAQIKTGLEKLQADFLLLDADLFRLQKAPSMENFLRETEATYPNLVIIVLVTTFLQEQVVLKTMRGISLRKGTLGNTLRETLYSRENPPRPA